MPSKVWAQSQGPTQAIIPWPASFLHCGHHSVPSPAAGGQEASVGMDQSPLSPGHADSKGRPTQCCLNYTVSVGLTQQQSLLSEITDGTRQGVTSEEFTA